MHLSNQCSEWKTTYKNIILTTEQSRMWYCNLNWMRKSFCATSLSRLHETITTKTLTEVKWDLVILRIHPEIQITISNSIPTYAAKLKTQEKCDTCGKDDTYKNNHLVFCCFLWTVRLVRSALIDGTV